MLAILTHKGHSEKMTNMKNFLSIVLLIFSIQSLVKAEDITDFEIEGITVGESLLKFASEIEIKKVKSDSQFPNDKYIIYDFEKLIDPKKFDWISVTAKKNDANYIITNIAGAIDYRNLEECLKLKKEIQDAVETLFDNVEKQDDSYASSQDKTGKSMVYGTQYYLKPYPSNEAISVNCYHMSIDSNIKRSLKLAVNTEEYAYFLINEAYE